MTLTSEVFNLFTRGWTDSAAEKDDEAVRLLSVVCLTDVSTDTPTSFIIASVLSASTSHIIRMMRGRTHVSGVFRFLQLQKQNDK